MSLISLESISFSYGQRRIFDNLNLKIKENEYIVIKGPSGVGKTTLINILGLIEPPDSGLVKFNRKTVDNSNKTQIKQKFNFMLQNPVLVDHLTVYENIFYISQWWGTEINEINDKIKENIKEYGIDKFLYQYPPKLSHGQKQRVSIFICFTITASSVVFLDEPFGSIDKDNKIILLNLLKSFYSRKKTIICVTHSDLFDDLADKIYEVKNYKLELKSQMKSKLIP